MKTNILIRGQPSNLAMRIDLLQPFKASLFTKKFEIISKTTYNVKFFSNLRFFVQIKKDYYF